MTRSTSNSRAESITSHEPQYKSKVGSCLYRCSLFFSFQLFFLSLYHFFRRNVHNFGSYHFPLLRDRMRPLASSQFPAGLSFADRLNFSKFQNSTPMTYKMFLSNKFDKPICFSIQLFSKLTMNVVTDILSIYIALWTSNFR